MKEWILNLRVGPVLMPVSAPLQTNVRSGEAHQHNSHLWSFPPGLGSREGVEAPCRLLDCPGLAHDPASAHCSQRAALEFRKVPRIHAVEIHTKSQSFPMAAQLAGLIFFFFFCRDQCPRTHEGGYGRMVAQALQPPSQFGSCRTALTAGRVCACYVSTRALVVAIAH